MIHINICKNNKGFTLVELLAVMAILSLVVSVVIYTAIGVIDVAKEKSYKVTINNIQSEASSYTLEDLSKKRWVSSSSYEYRCVTVKELIDSGYFDSNILKSQINKDGMLVNENHLIYLERDKNSKTITRNVMLIDDAYSSLCSSYYSAGSIYYEITPEGWAKEKTVKIYYNLDILDLSTIGDYKYSYISSDDIVPSGTDRSKEDKFEKLEEMYEVKIIKNGQIDVSIFHEDTGRKIYGTTISITGIDKEAPTGTISSTNRVSYSQDVTLNLEDSQSGILKYYFGKTGSSYDTDTNRCNSLGDSSWVVLQKVQEKKEINPVVVSEGTYTLCVVDVAGNLYATSKSFYRTSFSVSNVAEQLSYVITMDGNSFYLPTPKVSNGYVFGGWYERSNFSGSSITSYKPTSDKLLYGKTNPITYTITYNANLGTGAPVNGEKIHGTDFRLSSIIPKRTGYTFKGWNTQSDGKGRNYASGAYYTYDNDVTLYAQWEINTVTIKYKVHSDEILGTSSGYTKGTDNFVYKPGGELAKTEIKYNAIIEESGLYNYNNSGYINITKSGYIGRVGAEWKCLSGNCKYTTYNQIIDTYTDEDFCDISESNCTIILGVNWIKALTLKIENPYKDVWYNKNTHESSNKKAYKIKLTVTGESIDHFEWKYGRHDWSEYTNITCNSSKTECYTHEFNGDHNEEFWYKVVDIYGNEKVASTYIKRDITPPEFDSIYNPKEATWTNTSYSMELEASDAVSGVAYYYYDSSSTDDFVRYSSCNNKTTCTTSPWEASRNENVSLKVCDNAGNCTIGHSKVQIDKVAPTLEILNSNAGVWVKGPYQITLEASDSGSGVGYYYYRRSDDKGQFKRYDSSYNLSSFTDQWSADRNEDVEFKVCDKVNNCTTGKSNVKIDKRGPSISSCRLVKFSTTEVQRRLELVFDDGVGLKRGYEEFYDDYFNVVYAYGEYKHSTYGCNTYDSAGNRKQADFWFLLEGSSYYYQTFRCSGIAGNILEIEPLKICDNLNNCSTYKIIGDYDTNTCYYNKIS